MHLVALLDSFSLLPYSYEEFAEGSEVASVGQRLRERSLCDVCRIGVRLWSAGRWGWSSVCPVLHSVPGWRSRTQYRMYHSIWSFLWNRMNSSDALWRWPTSTPRNCSEGPFYVFWHILICQKTLIRRQCLGVRSGIQHEFAPSLVRGCRQVYHRNI